MNMNKLVMYTTILAFLCSSLIHVCVAYQTACSQYPNKAGVYRVKSYKCKQNSGQCPYDVYQNHTIECKNGFFRRQNIKLACTGIGWQAYIDNSWTSEDICVTDCTLVARPADMKHGSFKAENNNYDIGARGRLLCDVGYGINGTSRNSKRSWRCLVKNDIIQWKLKTAQQCKRKLYFCGNAVLPTDSKGTITHNAGNKIENTLTLTCSNGYIKAGPLLSQSQDWKCAASNSRVQGVWKAITETPYCIAPPACYNKLSDKSDVDRMLGMSSKTKIHNNITAGSSTIISVFGGNLGPMTINVPGSSANYKTKCFCWIDQVCHVQPITNDCECGQVTRVSERLQFCLNSRIVKPVKTNQQKMTFKIKCNTAGSGNYVMDMSKN